MDNLFIPAEMRPSVTLPLAQEAWAFAAALEPPAVTGQREFKPISSEGCLLVLARPEDHMASCFVTYAQAMGICCARPTQINDIDLCISVESDRHSKVEIYFGQEHIPIHSILNRGWPFSTMDQFQTAETYAAWWSAVACFSGPVINRSSRFGLVPDIEPLSIIKNVVNIDIPNIFIGSNKRPSLSEPELNVHLPDGRYIGRMNKQLELQLHEDEVYTFTGFDPKQIKYILLAADHTFDLSNEHGCLPSLLEEQLSDLILFLRTQNITFGLLVLQIDKPKIRLVRVNPFPALQQYKHIDNEVHSALLEYLVSDHRQS
jgi:hypothetical protein